MGVLTEAFVCDSTCSGVDGRHAEADGSNALHWWLFAMAKSQDERRSVVDGGVARVGCGIQAAAVGGLVISDVVVLGWYG